MIGMLILVISILLLVTMIPLLSNILNVARQSDHLNCKGFVYNGNSSDPLSYSSTTSTDSISCTAIDLTIPFIVLCVIIGGVAALLAGNGGGPSDIAESI